MRWDRVSEEITGYDEVVVSYVDEDGYPFSYPTKFEKKDNKIIVGRISQVKSENRTVSLLFNHIKPLPSGGYTDRRYVIIWGEAEWRDNEGIVNPVKTYGWDENKVHFVQYCEESVPRARRYLKLLEEKINRPIKPALSVFQLLFRATRLPFTIATVVPVLLGAAVAAYHGYFNPLLLILTLVGAVSIHLGLNMANDYFDTKLGADEINKTPTPFSGGSRIIQYGLLTPSSVITLSTLFYLMGIGIGLYLAFLRGFIPILSIMLLGFLLSFFYTAPPIKLAYRGLGELAVGTGFGPVIVMGSYYVQAQSFHITPLLASIPVGILIALILYVNEIPDMQSDAKAGKITLVVRLREKARVMQVYKILLALTYLSVVMPFILGYSPLPTLIALLTIPLARKTVKLVDESYGNPYYMIPGLASNIKLATATGIILAAGYAIQAIFNLFIL